MKTFLLSFLFSLGAFLSFGQMDSCDVAGYDSLLNVCPDDTVDLFWGLGGTYDTTGTWYHPSGNPINPYNYDCPDIPGQYPFVYINQHPGCPPDTSYMTMIVAPWGCDWGLDEYGISGISVYPNPVQNILTVGNDGPYGDFRYRIFALDGTLISTSRIDNDHSFEIDVSEFKQGIYYIHVWNTEQHGVYRVVKE